MRLFASDLCQCRGDRIPTTGSVHLGMHQCARCLMLLPGPDDEVVLPPRRTWRDDVADDEREVTPLHRRARVGGLMRRDVREAFDGMEP